MQRSSLSSGTDKITATCYKYSFDAKFVVVLKYMVKEINTKAKKCFRWKINGCYVLAVWSTSTTELLFRIQEERKIELYKKIKGEGEKQKRKRENEVSTDIKDTLGRYRQI